VNYRALAELLIQILKPYDVERKKTAAIAAKRGNKYGNETMV